MKPVKLDFSNINKSNYEAYSKEIVSSVKNGLINPLELVAKTKAMSSMLDSVRKEVMDMALEEIDKYNDKEDVTFSGYVLKKSEAGVTYDFDNCGDKLLDEYTNRLEEIKLLIKARHDYLKSIKAAHECYDPNTGEVWKVYPAIKRSTTIVKLS